jgi:chemotaxis-related protein WspB
MALMFSIGEDRYAVDVARLQEIVPLVALKAIPTAPPYIAGLLNFRGEPVPVVDVTRFAFQRESRRVFGTRILVVKYRGKRDTTTRLLGLIVEKVERTEKLNPEDFKEPGVDAPDAEFLGPVVSSSTGLVQLVHPNDLLSAEVHNLLYQKSQ